MKERRKKISNRSKEPSGISSKGYSTEPNKKLNSKNTSLYSGHQTHSSNTSNLKHSEKSTTKISRGFTKINSSGNFSYKVKKSALAKNKTYAQRFMKTITQYSHMKVPTKKRRSKNNTTEKKPQNLDEIIQKRENKLSRRNRAINDHIQSKNTPILDLTITKTYINAPKIRITDSSGSAALKQTSMTTKSTMKRFDFDTARHSADTQGPTNINLMAVESVAGGTERQRISKAMRNTGSKKSKRKTRNAITEKQSQALQSTEDLKRVT